MARILLLFLVLLATAAFAAPLQWVTTGACAATDNRVVVGTANEPWNFPEDNWDFHPLKYADTATAKVDDLANILTCSMTITGTKSGYPPYDVGFHTRYTDPALLFYQTGIQWGRYHILFSTVSKDIALYEEGVGFLAASPCNLEEGKTYAVTVISNGAWIVQVDGKQALNTESRADLRRASVGLSSIGFHAQHCQATFDAIVCKEGFLSRRFQHDPHILATRQWHGWLWIFDGNEPIARFMKYDVGVGRNAPGDDAGPYRYFGISDAKLRPGTPPATPWQLDWDCSLGGVGKAQYKTIIAFDVQQPTRDVLTFRWELAWANSGELAGRGTMTVSYDAKTNAYMYDCHTSKILEKPLNDAGIQYSDPWPYRVVGPATDDWKTWERRIRYFVYTEPDGTLRKIPLNHHWPLTYTFKPGTAGVFVSDNEVNPAFEMLTEGQTLTGGLCNWGYDLHMILQYPKEQLPLPKGKELTAHFRVTAYSAKQAQDMLAGAKFLDAFEKTHGNMLVPINTGQVLNRFGPSTWVKATDPFDAWIWEGLTEKNWDKTVGFDDTYSLRFDQPGQYVTRDFGAGGYYGVFPKGTYEFHAMVKTKDATGKGAWLSVQNWPIPDEFHSETVTGTADWTLLRVRFPGPIVGATLRLHLDGPGMAWIDNAQVVKVE